MCWEEQILQLLLVVLLPVLCLANALRMVLFCNQTCFSSSLPLRLTAGRALPLSIGCFLFVCCCCFFELTSRVISIETWTSAVRLLSASLLLGHHILDSTLCLGYARLFSDSSGSTRRTFTMRVLSRLRERVRARLELARARMNMRGIADHELIGRYCGLMLFPFVLYVCLGSMQPYSDQRIRNALKDRRKEP